MLIKTFLGPWTTVWFILVTLCAAPLRAQYSESVVSPPVPALSLIDTNDISRLLNRSSELLDSHTDSAIALFFLAENKSRQLNYDYGIIQSLMYLSNCYVINNNITLAKELLGQAKDYIDQSDRKQELRMKWYRHLCIAYKFEGQPDSAMWALQQALKLAEIVKDSAYYVSIYNLMGAVLIDNQDYKKAYPYIMKALAANNNENWELMASYINLGYFFASYNIIDSMYYYAGRALEAARSLKNPKFERAASLLLTKYYLSVGNKSKADEFAQNAIKLIEPSKTDNHLYIYRILCTMYVEVGEHTTALKYGKVALSSIKEEQKGRKDVINTYALLSTIYSGLHQYDSAYIYLRQYYTLADSINVQERNKALDKLQQQFDVAQKDKQILQNEAKVRNRNMWIITFAAGILFFILTSATLYIGYSRRIHILKQRKEIDKLRATMQGEEKERARIAQDLHDGIGSLLSATAIHLNTFSHQHAEITYNDPAFKQTERLVAEISNEVRHTAHNLMPHILLENNLPEAIKKFCFHIEKKQKLDIKFEFFGIPEDLSAEIQLFTYRIIQELIQNIIKHARASEVIVQLDYNDNLLSLTVEDNGIGYDTQEKSDGMGLGNIRSRVESMYGLMNVKSTINRGTSVYIELDYSRMK